MSRNPYVDRSLVLKKIGYSGYADYLKSVAWEGIRYQVLISAPTCSARCGKLATEIHHEKYNRATLEGKTLKYLHPVCRKCHERIEFDPETGKKLTPRQATKRLFELASEKKKTRRNAKADSSVAREALEVRRKLFPATTLPCPDMPELFYIRGILRNRFPHIDQVRTIALLKKAHLAGVTLENLRDLALDCFCWSNWLSGIDLEIEKVRKSASVAS